jgi:hypothetical protein
VQSSRKVLSIQAAMPLVKFVIHSKRAVVVAHFNLIKIYRSCPGSTVGDENLLIGAISRDSSKTALEQTNMIAKTESNRTAFSYCSGTVIRD